MQIYVNGTPHSLDARVSLRELVIALDLEGKRIAIEVNQDLVPRSHFPDHQLRDQDRVEIIHAVGGG
jgi:thiamine biosynthesis protein ThiS